MLDAGGSSDSDLDLYRSPKKRVRKAPKSFRMGPNLEKGLDALRRLWRVEAIARGDDPDAIKESYVVARLLEAGLDEAFELLFKAAGLKSLPVSDAEWAQFDEVLERRLKQK